MCKLSFLFSIDKLSVPMTCQRMPNQRQKCKGLWIACDNFDLTISTKNTEVVTKPAPGKPYSKPTITANGKKMQVVDKCTYL